MQENVLKKDILKKYYPKTFGKVTSFFLWNPISFNKQDHEQQKGPATSDHSPIR